MSCVHLSAREDVLGRAKNFLQKFKEGNKQLVCSVCKEDSTSNLWLCLCENCEYVGCETKDRSHFIEHAKDADHYICTLLDDLGIVCLKCNKRFQQDMLLEKAEFLDEEPKPKGLCGLANMGNTCYMNSALQSLSNCPALTQFFLKCEQFIQPTSNGKLNVAAEYHKLINTIWDPQRQRFFTPSTLARTFRIAYPHFRGYSQQDSQEFLRCLMDRLHEDLKRPVMNLKSKKPSQHCRKNNFNHHSKKLLGGNTATEGYNVGFKTDVDMDVDYYERSSDQEHEDKDTKEETASKTYHSIITDVFNGKLTSSVQCLTCHRISTTIENFQDLSLPIPGKDDLERIHTQCSPHSMSFSSDLYEQGWLSSFYDWLKSWFVGPQVSLHDCLAAFFAKDELKGDNMYNCEKCNKLRNGVKYLRVLSLPETLCIHLKRFRHEMAYSSKIGSYVMFPVNGLDLKNFTGQDCTSKCTSYDLCAVITHFGTVGGGHYVAYAKNCVSNKWYEFNDSLVLEVSEYEVENAEAYCLFYTKRSSIDQKFRASARERINYMNSSNYPDGVFVSREWLTRFETCCEPGQISNYDFLCPHGDVPPNIMPQIKKFVTFIPRDLWEAFQSRYGGGPEVSSLNECIICKELAKRRESESRTFTKLNEVFQKELDPEIAYCLSISWYKRWNAFTKGDELDPPGPVDNSDISEKKDDDVILKEDSDHGLVSEETWRFFLSKYGGGPELKINKKSSNTQEQEPNNDEKVVNNSAK